MKKENITKRLSIGIGLVAIAALPLSAALVIRAGHLREHFFLRYPQDMTHLREHACSIFLLALCLATALWMPMTMWILWAAKKMKTLKTQQQDPCDS